MADADVAVSVKHSLIGENTVRCNQILDQLRIHRATRNGSLGGSEMNACEKRQQEDCDPAHTHVRLSWSRVPDDPGSRGEAAVSPEKVQELEQRQPQNGEVVSIDPLEQMNTRPFELIGTDARQHSAPGGIEIAVKKWSGKRTECQARGVDGVKEDIFALHQRYG